MYAPKQKKNTYTKSPLSQQTASAKTVSPIAQASQSNPHVQHISRMSNASNANAHAAILNRAPANQQSSNRQFLLQLQQQYGNGYVNRVLQLSRQAHAETHITSVQQPIVQAARNQRSTQPRQSQPSAQTTQPRQSQPSAQTTQPRQSQPSERSTQPRQSQSSERSTQPRQSQSSERSTQTTQPKSRRSFLPFSKNKEKTQLLKFKDDKLVSEYERCKRLAQLCVNKRLQIGQTKFDALMEGLAEITKKIEPAIESVRAESDIRQKNLPSRKKELNQLRKNPANQNLYGGEDKHKIANVDIEAISQGLDVIEKDLVTTKAEAVEEYNQVATGEMRNAKKSTTNITTELKRIGDIEQIIVGGNIFIQPPNFASEHQNVQIDVLRMIRKMIQTPAGFNLISELVDTQQEVKIDLPLPGKSWNQASKEGKAGHGYKKGTLTEEIDAPDKPVKGTGKSSSSFVSVDPNYKLDISTKDPEKKPNTQKYNLPDDAALFHELTHALRAAQGKQDVTKLKQRKPLEEEKNLPQEDRKGDLYTKKAWVNKEEKAAVKQETEYLKQIGFPVKRIMYGKLASRIDK